MSTGAATGSGLDLLASVRPLRWLTLRRWFPLVLAAPMLLAFCALLIAGFVGTPVGNRNGLVVAVWILWWFLLIAVLVPVGGRAWCAACPIPFFGDWLQRGTLLGVRLRHGAAQGEHAVALGRNRYSGLGRRWPRPLSNLWLQTAGFLLLATFSAVLLTSPLASALTLAGMLLAATVFAALFRQRSFCRFLCPVGGFLGLYSMPAPLAVRARDTAVCAACRDKGCVAGNERGWGCPWLEHPSRLERNNSCGLCLECVRTCPHGNMSVFLRAPLSDRRLAGYDEAWKAFVMLALALAYAAVYLGPWGALKDAANVAEARDWGPFLVYAGTLSVGALAVLPGAFLGAAWLGRRFVSGEVDTRSLLLAGASALVPFGLLAWIAFSVPLVFANGSYVVAAASDPLGAGWDLLGTASLPWTPVLPQWIPWLQAALVLTGQAAGLWSGWMESRSLLGPSRRAVLGFAPTAALITAVTWTLLWLYTG